MLEIHLLMYLNGVAMLILTYDFLFKKCSMLYKEALCMQPIDEVLQNIARNDQEVKTGNSLRPPGGV